MKLNKLNWTHQTPVRVSGKKKIVDKKILELYIKHFVGNPILQEK